MFGIFKPKTRPQLHDKPNGKTYLKPSFDILPAVQAAKTEKSIDEFELIAILNLVTECRIVETNVNARTTVFHIDCKDVFQFPRIKKNLISLQAALHTEIKLIPSEKAHFALEIENKQPGTVHFKNCLRRQNGLKALIGADSENAPLYVDIEKAPHMLIAGQTGSGKSVLENSIIASLLMEKAPNELQLVLIDPKQVELSQYKGLPHLLTNIINDAQSAAIALNYCVQIMDERYKALEKAGLQSGKGVYSSVVIVIDELADLMLSSYKKPIETAITRLAQLGRAANIHLILATQRPTVNVVTGLIKANVPCRVALNVASVRDSMVIIDHKGAERLKGNGDGLLKDSNYITEKRIQGAYIDKATIKAICDYWKKQA